MTYNPIIEANESSSISLDSKTVIHVYGDLDDSYEIYQKSSSSDYASLNH